VLTELVKTVTIQELPIKRQINNIGVEVQKLSIDCEFKQALVGLGKFKISGKVNKLNNENPNKKPKEKTAGSS